MSGRVLVNGRLVPIEAAARAMRAHAPGQHSQKSHGGGSGDDDGGDAGEHGFGVDSKGVSYTEHDVDDAGNPKFSQSYRDEYGPLESNVEIGGFAVAKGEKRGIHVADDSGGAMNRRVVQDFTPKQARDVGEGVYAVSSGERESFSGAGVQVRPAGDGVDVTWADGTTARFGADDAFDLQEALDLA